MHIHLPKPLHGWREFAGEVGIIVLGILIALGAEQLIEWVHWRDKVHQATDALHVAVASGAISAAEQQVVGPCVDRQLALLQERLTAPGAYRAATLYTDETFMRYVVRWPSRNWTDGTWRIVTGEGVSTHLASTLRVRMDGIFANFEEMGGYASAADALAWRLNVLASPAAAEPVARARLVEDIEELRGRESLMTLVAAQMLGDVADAGMMPDPTALRAFIDHRSGTVAFCRAHHLPMARVQPINVN